MLTSSRRGLSYPNNVTRADSADVPRDIATLVAALELDVVFSQGTHAARPAAGAGSPAATGGGRLYWETDTLGLFYDTGAAWVQINSTAIAAGSITLAMLAANSVDASKIVDGSVGNAELAAGAVTAAKIAAALFPSQGAGAGTEALRALGSAAGQAAPGNDPRIPSYGTAFPTTGLVTGYNFTLFATIGGIAYAIPCLYRADLDATYPWHCNGHTEIIASGTALTASIVTPRAGVYRVRASANITTSACNLTITGSAKAISGATNGSVSISYAQLVLEDGPLTYTSGQTITSTLGGGTPSVNAHALMLVPLKLA